MKWSAISAILAAPLAFVGVVSAGVVARDDSMSLRGEMHEKVKRAGSIVVTVGGSNGELIFNPATLTGLNVGDVISFKLAPNAAVHSITQAVDANNLCEAAPGGVNHLFDSNNPPSETFDQTVEFAAPFYAFCNLPGHCQAGMKFSVNAP